LRLEARSYDCGMKVRAGKFRGSKLKMATGRSIRPATGRVKSAVFDILPMDLSDQMVLDLFAGAGSFGIEALSRGADYAVFVDQSRKAVELIKANLRKLGCFEQAMVMTKKASVAINQLGLEGAKFELVFVDPPFDYGLCGKTLAQLSRAGILAKDAVVVVRASKREVTGEQYGNLIRRDLRKYGDSMVGFYFWSSRDEAENEIEKKGREKIE